MIKKRLAALRAILRQENLDGVLVTLPSNRRYLSGFTPDDGQWGESSGAVLVCQSAAILLTDFRYELTAREQAELFQVVIYERGLPATLHELIPALGVKRLGFETEAMLYLWLSRLKKGLEDCELVPTLGLVSRLRVIKNAIEIKALRKSLELMEDVLADVLATDLVGRTERELALAITRAVEDAGAEEVAFDPVVASGPNAAEPHAEPGPRVIQRGDSVIFDVGAKLDGYCSDLSRTVVAGGPEEADPAFKEIYALTKKAQLTAISEIIPGLMGSEADNIARRIISEGGYGQRFGHSLGHGVGLSTHEDPRVGPNSPDILLPGMVFTVEPGIYLPGQGGVRLEDMVVLEDEGCRRLGRLDMFYDL